MRDDGARLGARGRAEFADSRRAGDESLIRLIVDRNAADHLLNRHVPRPYDDKQVCADCHGHQEWPCERHRQASEAKRRMEGAAGNNHRSPGGRPVA